MNLITLDFETYFDKDYSLKKLTTEAYLRDARFEVLGVSIKIGSAPAVWYQGPAIRRAIDAINWSQSAVLAHHAAFDVAILAWHYNKIPKFIFDTASMARPYHGQTIGVSLKALANHYQLGEKGDALRAVMGKHACDLTPQEWMELSDYCIQDNMLTHDLFHKLAPGFPSQELTIIDLTIRMFTEPVLELDTELLTQHLQDVREKKARLLSNITASKEDIMSNPKFAEALKGLGVDPPTKISARTGKETFAFAKTDPGLLALREHPDMLVQALVAARLGVKTTIEETRTEAFIEVSKRGTLPVMLNYHGAETSRFSGAGGLNLQNLPARDTTSRLKEGIKAPIGQLVLDADSSQIEARVLAYIAEQEDLLETFRDKTRDPYGEFATDIYGRKITRADKSERFAGKTSILQLGYQSGAAKFRTTLAIGAGGMKLIVDEQEAARIVKLYRTRNHKIASFWNVCAYALKQMAVGNSGVISERCNIRYEGNKIFLPNGLYIQYPDLRFEDGQFTYKTRKGRTKIYGGKVTAHICQGIMTTIIKQQMLEISKRYAVKLQVHDSLVTCVPVEQAKEARAFFESVMSTPPIWAPGLPVACEVKIGPNYGSTM